MAGTLFVVATPIGNLEDITARAIRILREVALIAAEDTRRTAHLLARYGIPTRTTSLHEHNERRKAPALLTRLLAGDSIALVSDAGTPTISDPGGHLIAEAVQAGVKVEPVPGPSAVIAALSVAGLPTDRFAFFGFPPIRSKDRKMWFDDLVSIRQTTVFYEAPHRIVRTLRDLQDRIGDVQVVVARELTKIHEELVRGPISTVSQRISPGQGEFVVLVDIGQTPNQEPVELSNESISSSIALEFGQMIDSGDYTRRQAISALSKRFRITSRQAYAAVEEAKKSVG